MLLGRLRVFLCLMKWLWMSLMLRLFLEWHLLRFRLHLMEKLREMILIREMLIKPPVRHKLVRFRL